jgi:hypothetical protein
VTRKFGLGDSRGLESLSSWTELERTVQESTGIDIYISRKLGHNPQGGYGSSPYVRFIFKDVNAMVNIMQFGCSKRRLHYRKMLPAFGPVHIWSGISIQYY